MTRDSTKPFNGEEQIEKTLAQIIAESEPDDKGKVRLRINPQISEKGGKRSVELFVAPKGSMSVLPSPPCRPHTNAPIPPSPLPTCPPQGPHPKNHPKNPLIHRLLLLPLKPLKN